MATARRSRSSTRSRSPRSGSRQSQSNPALPIVLGSVAVLVVVVIAFVMIGQGGAKTGGKKDQDLSAKVPEPGSGQAASAKQAPDPESSVKTLPGKTPGRPAPSISAAVIAEAEQNYQEARKLDIAARNAQKLGNSGEFNKLINDSWDKLIKMDKLMEEYFDWLDEAIFEGWEIPAEYVRLQKKLDKYDRLKGQVKRVRPNRR